MKKLVLIISCLLAAGLANAQDIKKDSTRFDYYNAESLPLYGKVCENTALHYSRLPESVKEPLVQRKRQAVWDLGLCSSGEFVRFSSNSGKFSLYWASLNQKALSNIAPVAVRGVALYVLDKGEWIFLGAGRPNLKGKYSRETINCSKLKGEMHEYLVYLSLYDGVEKLEIGVEKGSRLEDPKAEAFKGKPIIIYGTSIMQGGSASHPGMCSSNILGRMLGSEIINLGFSGNARLDYEIAELMASYKDPACFVMDNLPNCKPELIREKTEGFIKILRSAHPTVPIVFVENPRYPRYRFDGNGQKETDDKNAALKEVYDKMVSEGLKYTRYVKSDKMLPDDNIGTIEGTHFTDIGYESYCKLLYPVLKTIVR